MRSSFETWQRERWPLAAGWLTMALATTACGGNLGGSSYYPGYGAGGDGGACTAGAGAGYCGCVDRPYVVAVSLVFTAAGASALQDLDVRFYRQDYLAPSASANPPAMGTAGAGAFWLAMLEDNGGRVLGSLVFADASRSSGNPGYGRHAKTSFAMTLPSGATTLHIESWETGQVLIDLDLRGHLQLLCVEHPCLSVCPATPAERDAATSAGGDAAPADGRAPDGGGAVPLDGAVVDVPTP